MMRLGFLFALCSCWHFSAPEEPPPEPPPPLRPTPAARAAPTDAAPADAAPDAAGDVADLDAGRRDDAAVAPYVAPSPYVAPPCVRGRIISVSLTGSGIVLIVGTGANSGVARSWTVTMTDPARTPAQLLRVERAVTVIKVSGLTIDQIQRAPFVILCP